MKLFDLPVFFLDLQTTGSKPGQSHVLEMAWGDLSDDISSYLIQPPEGVVIPRPIRELTGITEAELKSSAVEKEKVFDELSRFLETVEVSSPAVIHYATFEKSFLEFEFQQKGQSLPFPILCTYQIAKRIYPNLPTRGIKGLAGYYGFVKEDVKRARSHVEATKAIWSGLIKDLEDRGIHTYEELQTWLMESAKPKRTKYEYPLPKEKRLSLPEQPGIYRMLSKKDEVLYVGKATSLKDRVNSYFRGKKGRDPKKLEMLTQVWDLRCTPCESPLEAALLETDEIKRYNPRYNISLKAGDRRLVFYSRDFNSIRFAQDEEHPVGPFSSPWILDSVIKTAKSLHDTDALSVHGYVFYEPDDDVKITRGFRIFCERHGLEPRDLRSVRSILAVGLAWYRNMIRDGEDKSETEYLENDETEETELTPEDYADKFERHFTRAGKAYWRARSLTRLLNSEVEFENPLTGHRRSLSFQEGILVTPDKRRPAETSPFQWLELDVDTYDRMSVLYSELIKLPKEKRKIHHHP